MMHTLFALLLFLPAWIAALPSLFSPPPQALYLTWIHDPTTTMVIQWHALKNEKPSSVFYKKINETAWLEKKGSSHPLSNTDLLVHTTELTDLEPGANYLFRVGQSKQIHRFRTLPSPSEKEIKFVVGGDAYMSLHLFKKMNAQITATNPDFIVVGGDIAYARGYTNFFRGSNWSVKRWQTFLEEWTKQMVAPDGRLIPMLPLLGNHDISKNDSSEPSFFFELFALPTPLTSYRSLDWGTTLSLLLLDTAHFSPIEGAQTNWLEQTLASKSAFPYKLAIYHVAAYPAVYDFNQSIPLKIRKHWVPLFEQFHLQAAFEHHNHAFKRTHKIKANQIDETGVVYLGDGAWGVSPRPTKPLASAWHLAQAKQSTCFWLVTLNKNLGHLQAFDNTGTLLDHLTLTPFVMDMDEVDDMDKEWTEWTNSEPPS